MEMFGSEPLYTTLEIRKIEEAAIRSHEHTGSSLMLGAARASFEVLYKVWPENRKIQPQQLQKRINRYFKLVSKKLGFYRYFGAGSIPLFSSLLTLY